MSTAAPAGLDYPRRVEDSCTVDQERLPAVGALISREQSGFDTAESLCKRLKRQYAAARR